MIGIFFLASIVFAVLAVWTGWNSFYACLVLAIVATLASLIVSFVRDRQPRGAHSRR